MAILNFLVGQTEIDRHPTAEQIAGHCSKSISSVRRALRWAKANAGLYIHQLGAGRGSKVRYEWPDHSFWRPAWHRRESSQVVKSEHLRGRAVRNISLPEENTTNQQQCSVVTGEAPLGMATDPLETENAESQKQPDPEIREAEIVVTGAALNLNTGDLKTLSRDLRQSGAAVTLAVFLAIMIHRVRWQTLESPIAYLRTSARRFEPRPSELRQHSRCFLPAPENLPAVTECPPMDPAEAEYYRRRAELQAAGDDEGVNLLDIEDDRRREEL